MILVFVLSMTGTLLSTDLGLAWVLIEATTLSSAYLIYFNKTKHSIEAAWKYVFICSIGIALAFVGIILLNVSSGAVNSMNFAQLYEYASGFDLAWLKLAFVFMLFGFGAKMGLAPIHFWLPDAHSEAPSPISALLSAALLNSAFLVIVRVFKIMEIANCTDYARLMLFVMGFLSLFVTTVFVYHIKNYKRMLAYSSIENMGILAIGMALGPVAYYAVVLHLIGHSLAKASFFLTSGNILELFDSKRIKSVSGIVNADGKTGWLWVASFLAICAFPTSVLFISEFLIIKAMILQKHYVLCVLFVLLLTIILFGIGRVVVKMTFGELSEDKEKLIEENKKKVSLWMYIPQVIMLVIVFVMGIYIPDYLNDIIKLAVGAF
jgi:hydrogenase-4 component F